MREWDLVIALAAGPANASVRREARTRILTLLARTNRGRLDERVRSLEAEASRDPADREGALFLAEAQQRLGNLPRARSRRCGGSWTATPPAEPPRRAERTPTKRTPT